MAGPSRRRALNLLLALGATPWAAGGALGAFMRGARAASARCEPLTGVPGITGNDFRRYVTAFNGGDFDGFGRFYADAVDFVDKEATSSAGEQVLDFYRNVKSRVKETLSVRDLVVGDQAIVADIVTELAAFKDWPDFPTGALKRGDQRISENFIWYDISAGKFAQVRSAHYRSGPLGAEAAYAPADCQGPPGMSVGKFASYIDAFNRDDYSDFGSYYDEDVELVIAGKTQLRGRQAIFDYYKTVKSQTRRTIRINKVIAAPHQLAAELQSEFLALEDIPHSSPDP